MSKEEITILRKKLKKARDSGKLLEISDYCCSLASCLSEEEEHEEALSLYKESLNVCEILENKAGIALANRMIAEECISLGYFEEALNHVNVFLKCARNDSNKVEEQRGLVLKGHVFFTQAEYLLNSTIDESEKIEKLLKQSMEAYRQSFIICTTQLPDVNEKERLQMKARLLQNKSIVLIRQNKLDHAQNHLIRAVKICSKEKLKDTECMCYLSLGDLYTKKGELENALNVYDKALELSHSFQQKIDSIICKAKIYILMEKFDEAKSILKKAYKKKPNDELKKFLKEVMLICNLREKLNCVSELETPERQKLCKKIGKTLCSLNLYSKGIKYFLELLELTQNTQLCKNDLIKCYKYLCEALTNDKQYNKALFYWNLEVEVRLKSAPERACKTYFRIAKLLELNGSDYEEIYFAYNKAKSNAFEFKNYKIYKKTLKHLVALGKKFNKLDVVDEFTKELECLKETLTNDFCQSESDSDNDSFLSTSDSNDGNSSEDLKDLLQQSEAEDEEFDRPKQRCKRKKFSIKRNEKGETDLHVAAIKGNIRKVKTLIDKGHPVNIRDTAGWTPLHEACNHGFVDIVNTLLDFGADINDKGGPCCDGITPLHDAAYNGQLEVVDTLIKKGASTLVLNGSG